MSFNLLKLFQPQDKKFFPLFERATNNVKLSASVLVKLCNTANMDERIEYIREIERLEHEGDAITHEIFNELSSTFITPFDREDIHGLATAIDDILDYIHGSSKRIELYNVNQITTTMGKLADILESSVAELHIAIVELKNLRNKSRIKEATVKINALENHADDIFDTAIAGLFDNETDAVQIIKIKEVLTALETATDKCEDAANVISSILVKHA